ncbi:MFS transporter [Streptomyces qinglanensis]|uniref:Predicted arabinose efflux permease, MFS family n=1 Tax=Streptomyces qinglanensis TaxID=943816 RepID=A0A1H9S4E6_9ACTN|nr:MFS transporter [Streptomyces qinglanensis]SER79834.1 Predicted arabinose efflux permease, MFS family [Streptomyces qinglanensis]
MYLSQPLLEGIARSLGGGAALLGAVPTATQLGYAAGILLLVPAGDSHDRRRLILTLGTLSSLALAACALAPTAEFLLAAGFALGLCSPVPQLVTPLAVALAEGRRGAVGQVVGGVQAGLLVGVLASRAYSGVLAEAVGWRGVHLCSCALTLALAALLRSALPPAPHVPTVPPAPHVPTVPPAPHVPSAASSPVPGYRAALASLPRLAAHPMVFRIVLSGALVGVAFGAFWTSLTFLLGGHYHYGPARIGLFGLVAAASAAASPWAGRAADRMGRRGASAALLALVLAGWLVLLPGGGSPWWLIPGVLLDIGVWGSQAASQTVLFTLDRGLHSRLNTVWFTARFLGIALGSLAGSLAWAAGAWPAVVAVGLSFSALGLLVAVLPGGDRRTPTVPRTERALTRPRER